MLNNATRHQANQLQIAVFPFGEAPLESLQSAARRVAPQGQLRSPGLYLERYRAHLAGRALLNTLLGTVGSLAKVVADAQFGYLKLSEPSPFGVNVSHTGSIAAAVLGLGSVGIDIERVERNADRAVKRVATPEEVERARAVFAGSNITPTIALWSAKEAVSKATGLGISFGMRAFQIDFRSPEPFPARLGLSGPLPLVAPAVRMLYWGDYVISVCAERDQLQAAPALQVVTQT